MRKAVGIFSLAALIVGVQAASGQDASQSQSQTQTTAKPGSAQAQSKKESVAEAARKAREGQKNVPKAPVVFTNDNIGATAASSTVSVVGNAPAPPASTSAEAASANASSAQAGNAEAGGAASSSSGNDEATWRKRFADARAKVQQDQAALALLQRELGQTREQYYTDPNKALKQSVSQADVQTKQQAIDKMQKQIQADQQALSSLEDELRKSGGDASWARE